MTWTERANSVALFVWARPLSSPAMPGDIPRGKDKSEAAIEEGEIEETLVKAERVTSCGNA